MAIILGVNGYIEIADVASRVRIPFDATTVPTEAQVEEWVEFGFHRINAAISSRYTTPLTDTTSIAILAPLNADFVVVRIQNALNKRRLSEQIDERFESTLRQIQDGTIRLAQEIVDDGFIASIGDRYYGNVGGGDATPSTTAPAPALVFSVASVTYALTEGVAINQPLPTALDSNGQAAGIAYTLVPEDAEDVLETTGLILDAATPRLTGIPNASAAGRTFFFALQAQKAGFENALTVLQIEVAAAIPVVPTADTLYAFLSDSQDTPTAEEFTLSGIESDTATVEIPAHDGKFLHFADTRNNVADIREEGNEFSARDAFSANPAELAIGLDTYYIYSSLFLFHPNANAQNWILN